MKNKGFTIVELLATVVLIGIISLVALGSYSGIKRTIMKAQTKNVVSNIESTAIIYSTSRDRVGWVPLTELVDNEFIDKTDLERIDEFEDENGDKCYLLTGEGDDATINTEVGIFIGQKYAKTSVTTTCDPSDPECDATANYSVNTSEGANLVKTADFYCKKVEKEEDQVKYGTAIAGSETSSRFRSYSLDIVDESPEYIIVHLSCTNGLYRYPGDALSQPGPNQLPGIAAGVPFRVDDMTANDSCSLLLYSQSKGIYKKYTYLMSGGS
jgi:prepilin-type N-terminal cleavage/methylation domain-containing protein